MDRDELWRALLCSLVRQRFLEVPLRLLDVTLAAVRVDEWIGRGLLRHALQLAREIER